MIYPKQIQELLDLSVVGQKDLKEVLSTMFTRQFLKINNKVIPHNFVTDRLLIVGQSGTGKTFTLKELNRCFEGKFHFLWVNSPEYTGAGWHGNSLSDVTRELMKMVSKELKVEITRKQHEEFVDVNKLSPDSKFLSRSYIHQVLKSVCYRFVIVFDEFDKIFVDSNSNDSKSIGNLQGEFLKFIEDCPLRIEYGDEEYDINLKDFLMVFLGAFEGLNKLLEPKKYSVGFSEPKADKNMLIQNALVEFGFRRELIGRISAVVFTKPLTSEEIFDIIRNHPYLKQIKAEFDAYNVSLEIKEEFFKAVASEVKENHEGARGILRIFRLYFDKMFSKIDQLSQNYEVISLNTEVKESINLITELKEVGNEY